MEKKNTKLLFRTLNVWFAFIALVLFSINLPHWANIAYHTWINEAIYFLLFIISVSIFLKEKNNRDIYFNFSILFLLHSLRISPALLGLNFPLTAATLKPNNWLSKSNILMFFIFLTALNIYKIFVDINCILNHSV